MAKRKLNKLKTTFLSVLALIVGLVFGFIANIVTTLPDSYEIPAVSQGSTHIHTNGEIDVQTIKSNDLSIHFLELGNKYTGDCTLIKSGNTELLIDAGSKASSVDTLKTYIDTYCTDGILEYVVVTHAHQDHYAGFATNSGTQSLFDYYTVGTVIDFGNATNKTASNKMYSNYLRELGEEITSGAKYHSAIDCVREQNGAVREHFLNEDKNIYFEILYQKFYEEHTDDENDYSVCLQVVHGTKKFLFTGDLEEDGEESLVEHDRAGGMNYGRLGYVEVYKAGHHGSKTSSSNTLLQTIQPKIVCVCCCAGSSEYTTKNENQFPTQAFIDRVSLYTSNIFVTTICIDYNKNIFESLNGNIVISSNGTDEVILQCSNNTTKLKDTEWFKQNRTLPNGAVE